jgi:predicted Zn-ribbon and HTH transcriptional regulator
MDISDLESLVTCQECGNVFDKYMSIIDKPGIAVCPACKHEYELPKKINIKE